MARVKHWAHAATLDATALCVAGRDSRTPWLARAMVLAVVAFALSPIDLIPDFIPVLGHSDDLVIIPMGILLIVRLNPGELMSVFRASASIRERAAVAGLIAARSHHARDKARDCQGAHALSCQSVITGLG